jgi:hypothetical protein
LLVQRRQRQAIFWLQVRVSGGHLCNLPGVQALHFGVETAPKRCASMWCNCCT